MKSVYESVFVVLDVLEMLQDVGWDFLRLFVFGGWRLKTVRMWHIADKGSPTAILSRLAMHLDLAMSDLMSELQVMQLASSSPQRTGCQLGDSNYPQLTATKASRSCQQPTNEKISDLLGVRLRGV
jgi:hypothetical protein